MNKFISEAIFFAIAV